MRLVFVRVLRYKLSSKSNDGDENVDFVGSMNFVCEKLELLDEKRKFQVYFVLRQ